MSGRSTPRSMTSPSTIAMTSVRGSATRSGSFMFRMVAHETYAPKSTSSPGPKLTTLEALKMRTNPSAMREYTPPTAMPVMMSWSMKTRCSSIRLSLTAAPAGGDAWFARKQVLDHVAVLREDRRAADLLGPRQLVIVGVELLVEQGEPADSGDGGEVLVHARHRLPDHSRHLPLLREVLERGEGQAIGLGPVPHIAHVDLDQRDDVRSVLADHDRFTDVRVELQLVLDERRGEARAVGQLQDVLQPVDDDEVALLV